MLLTATNKRIVRSTHHKQSRVDDDTCFYENSFTLDPSEVRKAWNCLDHDVFALEIARLPIVVHTAFKKHLRKKSK